MNKVKRGIVCALCALLVVQSVPQYSVVAEETSPQETVSPDGGSSLSTETGTEVVGGTETSTEAVTETETETEDTNSYLTVNFSGEPASIVEYKMDQGSEPVSYQGDSGKVLIEKDKVLTLEFETAGLHIADTQLTDETDTNCNNYITYSDDTEDGSLKLTIDAAAFASSKELNIELAYLDTFTVSYENGSYKNYTSLNEKFGQISISEDGKLVFDNQSDYFPIQQSEAGKSSLSFQRATDEGGKITKTVYDSPAAGTSGTYTFQIIQEDTEAPTVITAAGKTETSEDKKTIIYYTNNDETLSLPFHLEDSVSGIRSFTLTNLPDGSAVSETICANQGASIDTVWTFQNPAEGNYTLSAEDYLGNRTVITVTVVIDKDKPVIKEGSAEVLNDTSVVKTENDVVYWGESSAAARRIQYRVKDKTDLKVSCKLYYSKDGSGWSNVPLSADSGGTSLNSVLSAVAQSEPDEDGYVLYYLDLPNKFLKINGNGNYRVELTLADKAGNSLNETSFYAFVYNTVAPAVSVEKTSPANLDNSWSKTGTTQKVSIKLEGQQNTQNIYYALTSSTGSSQANVQTPGDGDWKLGQNNTAVTITLPETAKREGTVYYYLWVKDIQGKTAYKTVRVHYDTTPASLKDLTITNEKSTSILDYFYAYCFGTVFNGDTTVNLSVKAEDAQKAVYETSQSPGIEKVLLYYADKSCVYKDDSELGAGEISDTYQKLSQDGTVKCQQGVYRSGRYEFALSVPQNDKFYKLYFVVIDKAGNTKVLNAASLSTDLGSALTLVDDKKPSVSLSLGASCKQSDYQENKESEVKNWYKGSTVITYDINVKDNESGLFQVAASINGKQLKKDTSGLTLIDNSKKSTADLKSVTMLNTAAYQISPSQGTIEKDGSCKVIIQVEDNVGNQRSTSDLIYIDEDAPVVTGVKFDTGNTDDLQAVPLQYGYFFQSQTEVTAYATDYIQGTENIGSGVKKFIYKLTPADGSTVLSGEVKAQVNEDGIYTCTFQIPAEFKGQIYVKAVDHVGQESKYYNPKGSIIESLEQHKKTSDIKIDLPETDLKDNEGNPLYNKDITIDYSTKDTYSGLRENSWAVKEYYENDNLLSGTLGIATDYDSAAKKWSTILSGDTYWQTDEKLDYNLVTQAERQVGVSANTNHILTSLTMTDNAGNVSTMTSPAFSIDKTAPEITVEYDNNNVQNEKYYKEARTATVTVKERNFSKEKCSFSIQGGEVQISDWKHVPGKNCNGSVHTDECTYTCQVTFSQDGDYTWSFECTDLAGWKAEYQSEEFTIDLTKPVISVSYDNNASQNGSYFSSERIATIRVDDKNFNPADTKVDITAQKEGQNLSVPAASAFIQSGDTWTATVQYVEDADYTFHVASTDKAGNVADDYATEQFTVDQTAPEITIDGVTEKSANKGEVAPVIHCSDINMDGASLNITLTGANHGKVAYESSEQVTDKTVEVDMNDFKYDADVDDLYTLEVDIQDRAGNHTTETRSFSVNRFGSVYVLEDTTKSLIDNFYSNKEQNLVIEEINVDTLEFKEIDCSRDGEINVLEDGTDYEVDSRTEDSGWKTYKYEINAENFSEEGNYVVTIYSEDLAQNKSSNKAKGKDITFVIDKTAPSVVVAGVEDSGQYTDASRNITVDAQDNILLDRVKVYSDDELKKEVSREELMDGDGLVKLALPGSNSQQTLYVVAQDAAGNVSQTRKIKFLITSNLFVQWYTNTPLFAGSIAGTSATAAGAVLLIRRRLRLKHVERRIK